MRDLSFAICTVSYAPDFERCALLARSIQRFVAPPVTHYIVVERRDLNLFRRMEGLRTRILAKEEFLPWWVRQLPLGRRWWVSLKTLPVRGWILQQAVKLALSEVVSEDVLVLIDSEVVFVRPFFLGSFVRDGLVRLYRVPGDARLASQAAWHRTALRLVGLPPSDYSGARYIDQPITWRRENVLALWKHLEQVSGRPWIETILRQVRLSEFILYGVFVDRILAGQSGHYEDPVSVSHSYWGERPMSDRQLRQFLAEIRPEHVAVMISGKAGVGVGRYEPLLASVPLP
jgi:hypothetical protein